MKSGQRISSGAFPPSLRRRGKGAPVINFRSEGRRFPKGRCLIPASHFFEFTGSKSRNRSGNSQGRRELVLLGRLGPELN
jgi:putative SOS response-associated peptidase YedK